MFDQQSASLELYSLNSEALYLEIASLDCFTRPSPTKHTRCARKSHSTLVTACSVKAGIRTSVIEHLSG